MLKRISDFRLNESADDSSSGGYVRVPDEIANQKCREDKQTKINDTNNAIREFEKKVDAITTCVASINSNISTASSVHTSLANCELLLQGANLGVSVAEGADDMADLMDIFNQMIKDCDEAKEKYEEKLETLRQQYEDYKKIVCDYYKIIPKNN